MDEFLENHYLQRIGEMTVTAERRIARLTADNKQLRDLVQHLETAKAELESQIEQTTENQMERNN